MSAAKKRPARKPRAAVPAPAAVASVESVAARLRALPGTAGEQPALWRKTDLGRALSRMEKGHLDAALARLQADGQLVVLAHGENVFFAFAETLRGLLAATPNPPGEAALSPPVVADLPGTYRRLVRESGGFPDVKISALARALGPAAARTLPEQLIGAWRTGDAMLSLGDWSLANEEMRAAAVELDGEKYLLVRFEESEAA